jgi:rhamnosyl/mannosyltransferase
VLKFSIITSTYNRVNNLKELHNHIIQNQNYLFNIEWVVIVEKEDVETIKFLRSVFKKKIAIKIIINRYPKKFNKLTRQGIKNSTGDYLIILGDDDLIKKNALINIYKFIKKNSSKFIITPVTYHNEKKEITRRFITIVKSKLISLNLRYLLRIINYYMTPGIIVSRNLILKVNYFDEKVGSSNDWSTWLDLLNLEKPHILNNYYFSAGYNIYTISGGLNFNKYYYLLKIIYERKFNFITKISSFLTIFIIFWTNFLFKNITYIIDLFIKPKIYSEEKKILHITRNFNKNHQTGGIEQFIAQTAEKFNYKQNVISYSDRESQEKLYKKCNLYLFKKTFSIFNDCFSFSVIRFLIKQSLNYKIIHLHQPHPFSYLYILLLPFKKKIIITYHSDILRFKFAKWVVTILEVLTKRQVDLYHFSTKLYKENCNLREVKNYFIESFSINKKNIRKENIPINLIKNLPKKYVLFIGRDRHYKGFDKLKNLILSNQHINFVCITNHNFFFKSKNLKIFNNINDDIKLYLLKNSHININTSDNMAESFGFSILESLSFSVPVVIFRMKSGTNYLIRNNINGYIIDNFDINIFSKKINNLYNNLKLHKIFKRNTYLDYKKRLKHNYENLNRVYMKLLNS